MFWKLCKHELKCSYRSFLVLYAIVVAAALVMNPNNDGMLTNLAAFVYVVMCTIMFIMCVVVVIKNYSNSMFSRNSYLTHTLPVTSTQLLLTKILSAVFWILVSLLVLFISMLIIGLRVTGFDFAMIGAGLQELFSTVFAIDTLLYLFYIISSLNLSGDEYYTHYLCTTISYCCCNRFVSADILDFKLSV